MTGNVLGGRNRLFGWALLLVGILGGMGLGTFVFDGPLPAPERFAEYGSLPRRLLRFSHIAAMALGILNVLYGSEIDRSPLGEKARQWGSSLMIAAGTLMPIFLLATAFELRFRATLAVPATAAFLAIAILARGLVRRDST